MARAWLKRKLLMQRLPTQFRDTSLFRSLLIQMMWQMRVEHVQKMLRLSRLKLTTLGFETQARIT
jgi:hypothetical protein